MKISLNIPICTCPFFLAPCVAHAATRAHALMGANATQVTVTGEGQTSISNGYASYTLGAGFSHIPNPNLVVELETFFTNRKFGFADTHAGFSTFQVPLTAEYHFWQYHIGAGLYSALWSFNGETLQHSRQPSRTARQPQQNLRHHNS